MLSLNQLLLQSIQQSSAGLTLAELLVLHPNMPRRTAQRWISQLIDEQKIFAEGQGRARRYHAAKAAVAITSSAGNDTFPAAIPLSADSRDILAYIDKPLQAQASGISI